MYFDYPKMVCVYLVFAFWHKPICKKPVLSPHLRFHKMQPHCLACSVLSIIMSGQPEAPVDHEDLCSLLVDGWVSGSDSPLVLSSFHPKQNACKYCCIYRCFYRSVQRTCAHNTGGKQRFPGLVEMIDDMSRRKKQQKQTPDTCTILTFPVRCLDLAHFR